ncbi:cold-shock protein [Rhodococcus artemisiae]|uniref:cold-shock protein n=1 Tax=Rhodococcus artemisiae TaxID=714159 RepID=UPI0038B52699
MTSRDIVRSWKREEGWGAIDCAQTPAGRWVHCSEVSTAGIRMLTPGQEVTFERQRTSRSVEGFAFVATRIQPVEAG